MSATEMLAVEIVDALAEKVKRDPKFAQRIQEAFASIASDNATPPDALFMTTRAYAQRVGLGRRSVEKHIVAGMPTIGHGCGRRIDVERADAWLRSRDAGASASEEAEATELGRLAGERLPLIGRVK